MVIEMTSLQGIMGRFYALHSGEAAGVANAIAEHYLPKSTGDALPRSKAGQVIGAADRLDSLSGLFAAGLAPSGTKDPFAQRRAALGLVQALIGCEVTFDLRQGLALAAEGLPVQASPETLAACFDFVSGRLRTYLTEEGGFRFDVVDAVLAVQSANPLGAWRAAQDLTAWIARPEWKEFLPAYSRCVRITREFKQPFSIQPTAFGEDVERDLFKAIETAEAARVTGSVDSFVRSFLPLVAVVNRFFEAVLVMAEDSTVRANRLGLLQRVAALASGAADLSALEGF
jgi:glycyl-tRNA synthetase